MTQMNSSSMFQEEDPTNCTNRNEYMTVRSGNKTINYCGNINYECEMDRGNAKCSEAIVTDAGYEYPVVVVIDEPDR